MRKSLVLVAIALALSVPFVLEALKSDEEKILDLIHEAYEGFGNGSVSDATECLAGEFKVEPGGYGKGDLKRMMLGLARESRDEAGFKLKFVVAESSETVAVSGDKAHYEASLSLYRREKDEHKLLWVLDLQLELKKIDGWQVTKASYQTESGRPGY